MSRRKRIVIPGLPHHITQRGARRQNVFFAPEDRLVYKSLLAENAKRFGVEIISYCLMTNHVHLLVVPLEEDSLRWTFQYTHRRYAARINGNHGWSGHLWQERFYSSPVDDIYFWIALRYIEQNPLSAGFKIAHPADYPWSSAAARCNNRIDPLLTTEKRWVDKLSEAPDWRSWLLQYDDHQAISQLRKNTLRDLPTGSAAFLRGLERDFGVKPYPPKLGRPEKKGKVVTDNIYDEAEE